MEVHIYSVSFLSHYFPSYWFFSPLPLDSSRGCLLRPFPTLSYSIHVAPSHLFLPSFFILPLPLDPHSLRTHSTHPHHDPFPFPALDAISAFTLSPRPLFALYRPLSFAFALPFFLFLFLFSSPLPFFANLHSFCSHPPCRARSCAPVPRSRVCPASPLAGRACEVALARIPDAAVHNDVEGAREVSALYSFLRFPLFLFYFYFVGL
ncbi:hypothetical protein B0H11DRAFT_857808 [Mycena galericulata]|nr:hypothetical protein B0H11DRAFT_857808 [Mycena galericulata]